MTEKQEHRRNRLNWHKFCLEVDMDHDGFSPVKGINMDLIIYHKETDDLHLRLLDIVDRTGLSERMSLFSTQMTFISRLFLPKHDMTIAIIVIKDIKELECIAQYKDILMGVRIILVLPETGNGVKALSRALHARLVLSEKDDLAPVEDMLSKLNKQCSKDAF